MRVLMAGGRVCSRLPIPRPAASATPLAARRAGPAGTGVRGFASGMSTGKGRIEPKGRQSGFPVLGIEVKAQRQRFSPAGVGRIGGLSRRFSSDRGATAPARALPASL